MATSGRIAARKAYHNRRGVYTHQLHDPQGTAAFPQIQALETMRLPG